METENKQPTIEGTTQNDDTLIDKAAREILEKYKEAFKELAK